MVWCMMVVGGGDEWKWRWMVVDGGGWWWMRGRWMVNGRWSVAGSEQAVDVRMREKRDPLARRCPC